MSWIQPQWPAPRAVRAISTTRTGGVSRGTFASLNLAAHVGDEESHVLCNRAILRERCRLPAEPHWLRQEHGCRVVLAQGDSDWRPADAAIARRPGQVCAVLTADCLPVLLCDASGRSVAAVHAGWRGLAAGVLEAAVGRLGEAPDRLLAWLGPAIGPTAFEVGPEVRARFLAADPAVAAAFRPGRADRWLADIYTLARKRLRDMGIDRVFGGGLCTYRDPKRFFSYRRDRTCGRMATLIWLAGEGLA